MYNKNKALSLVYNTSAFTFNPISLFLYKYLDYLNKQPKEEQE